MDAYRHSAKGIRQMQQRINYIARFQKFMKHVKKLNDLLPYTLLAVLTYLVAIKYTDTYLVGDTDWYVNDIRNGLLFRDAGHLLWRSSGGLVWRI